MFSWRNVILRITSLKLIWLPMTLSRLSAGMTSFSILRMGSRDKRLRTILRVEHKTPWDFGVCVKRRTVWCERYAFTFAYVHRHYGIVHLFASIVNEGNHWPFCFRSFLVLNPRKPAWILVAAVCAACCLFRTKNPRMPAWIFVADFSSIDSLFSCFFGVPSASFFRPGCCSWPCFVSELVSFKCLRTRYPRKLACIFVAATLAFIVFTVGSCDIPGLRTV